MRPFNIDTFLRSEKGSKDMFTVLNKSNQFLERTKIRCYHVCMIWTDGFTVKPRFIAPRFTTKLAYRQEFLQSRFPYVVITPLKCWTDYFSFWIKLNKFVCIFFHLCWKCQRLNAKEICLIFDRKEKLWKLRIQQTMKQLDIDILANDVLQWLRLSEH
jgi:hypothetical protein